MIDRPTCAVLATVALAISLVVLLLQTLKSPPPLSRLSLWRS